METLRPDSNEDDRGPRMSYKTATALLLGLMAFTTPSLAVECTVPGSHDTVQSAIDDPNCNPITLADATFPESLLIYRLIILEGVEGGSTTIEGRITITETASQVDLGSLTVRSGCPDQTMEVEAGAVVFSRRVVVGWSSVLPCPPVILDEFFYDGFEPG